MALFCEDGPMSTSPDARPEDVLATLLVRSASGDQAAFAELYDATSSRVFGMVLRVLRDRHQSEEVVQEVFLAVWQTAERFDPARGSALAWVLTTAHRRAVDRVRSSDAARRRDQTHADRTFEAPYDSTASAVEVGLESSRVRSALTTLTALQREAIELAYFGGHTHVEVSRLLSIPVGTAKTRIRDGLIKLRDALATPNVQLA